MSNDNDRHIREAAYYLWLDAGQPHGRDREFWQQAEDALNAPAPKAKRKPAARKPAAKAPATRAAKAPATRVTKAKTPAKKATKPAK